MTIMNGKEFAANLRRTFKTKIDDRVAAGYRPPSLVIFSIGDDPASQVYVRNKMKACEEMGIKVKHIALPTDTHEPRLISTIHYYNAAPWVDGIMVQLPLPKGFNERKIIDTIDPDKDVDGLTTIDVGRLRSGQNCLKPCTAQGVIDLCAKYKVPLEGRLVTIVGRSNIVGKPLVDMFLAEGATVIQCHSKTPDISNFCYMADVVVSAVGKAGIITADMIKPNATVIDVGINRDAEGKLCGDVEPAAANRTGLITPVPGGVGPMTVAELMINVVTAWEHNINKPYLMVGFIDFYKKILYNIYII